MGYKVIIARDYYHNHNYQIETASLLTAITIINGTFYTGCAQCYYKVPVVG